MLLNLHKKKWTDGLTLKRFDTHSKTNEQTVQVSNFHGNFFNQCCVVFISSFSLFGKAACDFQCPIVNDHAS